MLYAKVIGGIVQDYPVSEAAIRTEFAAQVSFGSGPFSPPAPYVEVDEVDPQAEWDDAVVELPLVYENGRWHQAWNVGRALQAVVDQRLAAARTVKLAALADYRWQRETGGMVFMGFPLATDGTSQTKYIGAAMAAQIDPALVIHWKCADGSFVSIDAAAILGIAQAVRAHVQACFDREAELAASINSQTTVPAIAAVDITGGWPT